MLGVARSVELDWASAAEGQAAAAGAPRGRAGHAPRAGPLAGGSDGHRHARDELITSVASDASVRRCDALSLDVLARDVGSVRTWLRRP